MIPPTPTKNAVVEALRFVLGANARLKIFDYGDNETFDGLWTLGDILADRILIVWSDTAPDSRLFPVNTAAALSPVDWAVTYVARRKENPKTWPEVLILDLHPAAHRAVPSLAHFRILRPDQFPWMQVVNGASLSLSTVVSWLGTNPPTLEEAECKEALALFLMQVCRNLTQTTPGAEADHHAVTNICGPMVLARPKKTIPGLTAQEGVADISSPSAHTSALRTILEAVGAFRKGPSPVPLAIEDMKLVLIDDQASHGWESWLKACVPDEQTGQIIARSTPGDIFDFLESCRRRGDEPSAKSKDRRFCLVLPGCEKDDSSALLLDLRLFSGRVQDEKQFFSKLVELIDAWQFVAGKDARLAWDPLPAKDVDCVRAWADEPLCSNKPADDVLLTLFPRFLALLDPSLPIVIFSTTLQRPLFEKLKNYGNIYTGLNKNPFIDGTEPIDYLRDILPTLRAFNESRKRFRSLDNVVPIEPMSPSIMHWEIYIDEARVPEKNFFRVAGLMVGYENELKASAIHSQMSDLGIQWGEKDGPPTWKEGFTKRLGKPRNGDGPGQSLDDQWNSIAPKLEQITAGLPTYSFCLFKEIPAGANGTSNDPERPRLGDPGSLDNIYFSLLNGILEAALFDVLEKVNSSPSLTVSIFAATRLRAILSAPATEAWIAANREKYAAFGVLLHLLESPSYQALQMDGLLPVVAELLEMRRGSGFTGKLGAGILAAAAIPMNQPDRRDPAGRAKCEGEGRSTRLTSPPFRHLHFVADIMASLADSETKAYGVLTKSAFGFGPSGVNKALFARREGRDRGFGSLQQISRLLDPMEQNVITAAWLFLQMDRNVDKILEIGIFARSVLIRLKEALESDLTGLQMKQIAFSAPDALSLVASKKSSKADSAKLSGQVQERSMKNLGLGERRHQAASAGQIEEFKALQRRWRVKKFENPDGYHRSNENWHTIDGYVVKVTSSRKVWVFADLEKILLTEVAGFVVPTSANLFADGAPCGRDLFVRRPR